MSLEFLETQNLHINNQVSNYVLNIYDTSELIIMNLAVANTITIPNDATVDFLIGARIYVQQTGVGQTSIVGALGVTINSQQGILSLAERYCMCELIKTAPNTWTIQGGIIPTTNYLRGNTLTVDSVYGNDTNATANPNSVPFLTIGAALAAAVSGNNVIVNGGIYEESIVIPSGVCVTGASTQAVIIRQLGVTTNTTLVTINTNARLENVTCNLSSSGNFNLTGVEFATGASINAKIRTTVWNITSTSLGSPTIVGALSSGVSSTSFSSGDAIARSTINVTSSSTGISRGVYVNGANRFTIRESVIFATGTGSNIVGFECNNASSVVAIRTSTIDGLLYDVNRALGTMLIGGTDLVNNTANGNSFTATQAPASFSFGTINGLATNRRYYMLTGTVPVGQLVNEATSNAYDPLLALPIPVTQVSLVIAVTMAYQPSLPVGTSITLNIYKNSSLTPEIALTMLPADGGLKRLDTQSFSLGTLDVIRVTLETTGNVGAGGAFQAVIGYY
jgi:hypothetical protein